MTHSVTNLRRYFQRRKSLRRYHQIHHSPSSYSIGLLSGVPKRSYSSTSSQETSPNSRFKSEFEEFDGFRSEMNSSPSFESTFTSGNHDNSMCTEVSIEGEITFLGGKLVKHQLCLLSGLETRDLRKLDGTLRNQLPAILSRPSAILINMYVTKAVIRSNAVVFFDGIDHSERLFQKLLIVELRERLAEHQKMALKFPESSISHHPFEFIVLEVILANVCRHLQKEFDSLVPQIESAMTNLEGRRIYWEKLKSLLQVKKRINNFRIRVDNIRDAIAEVLNSDSDMSNMYLTEKALNPVEQRLPSDHEALELVLEAYLKYVDEISSRLQELEDNVQSTEEIVNIGLEGQRNDLLLLELKLTMGTFAAGIGSFGASVFGMNLRSYLENNPYFFYITTGVLFAISGFVYRRCNQKLRLLLGAKK